MDNLTTILIALGTGATIKASPTTRNQQVKTIYENLIHKIQTKFRDEGIDDEVLMAYEVAPTVWRSELKEELSDLSKSDDPQFNEIVDCAQELLEQVEPERAYDAKVRGTVQGYNQGNYQQVIMNFGSASKAPEQQSGI